jgi:hypothetical protein
VLPLEPEPYAPLRVCEASGKLNGKVG